MDNVRRWLEASREGTWEECIIGGKKVGGYALPQRDEFIYKNSEDKLFVLRLRDVTPLSQQ